MLAHLPHLTKYTPLLKSKTFWINIITTLYVLLTGNIDALAPAHLNDHVTITTLGAVNIIVRIWFTNSQIQGVIK